VIIVGILAAIALPSYREFIRRGHETEAQGQIMELAASLEAYKAKNFSYGGANISTLAPILVANPHYNANVVLSNGNQSFSITATPSSALMSGMPALTLDSAGNASWD